MLIDGEKYACEACVRGHRVSACQHHERPLQHINKKGRPVSQCQHCRLMRKSRASHIKCDCGEKTHKCKHLQNTAEGHTDSCCCNHGGSCSCTHKKEHPQLDTVPESDSDDIEKPSPTNTAKCGQRRRRRAITTSLSEGILSFDENGHHKPIHKHKASQNCGPYQLNRVNLLQSSSSNRSVDSLLQGPVAIDPFVCEMANNSQGATVSQRRTKSEATSPLMTTSSSFAKLNGQLPPLDLSVIDTTYVPKSADFFCEMSEYDQPMFSAALSATSVDWSHYDGLDFASRAEFAPSSYSQAQSYGPFDYGSEQMPTLTTTTSTSGEVSEVEDMIPVLEEFDADLRYRNGSASSTFDALAAAQANLAESNEMCSYENIVPTKPAEIARLVPTAPALNDEESAMGPAMNNLGGFIDDDAAFWVDNYSGLPSMGDGIVDTSESNVMGIWDRQ